MRWRATSWPKNAEFPWAGRRSRTDGRTDGRQRFPAFLGGYITAVLLHSTATEIRLGWAGGRAEVFILLVYKEGGWESWGRVWVSE